MPNKGLKWLGFFCLGACTESQKNPIDASSLDTAVNLEGEGEVGIELSEPVWVIPGDALPNGISVYPSNNNVSIYRFEDRLYLGWRTAPTHFASTETQIHLISSVDEGQSWEHEHSFAMGADLREPLFYEIQGTLFFSFFEGGTDSLGFEPQNPWRSQRSPEGEWLEAEQWGVEGEVPWEIVPHEGVLYYSSYLGPHYELGHPGEIDLRFQRSQNGLEWTAVSGDEPVVYHGGGTEAAFGFDLHGTLWAVIRNEEGDATGFGSLLCKAEVGAYGVWLCPEQGDPERYDSPRIFQHDDELYLVARRDVGGPYDMGMDELDFAEQQLHYLGAYSSRPKRTALYRIDREKHIVVHLMDFPSAGDTAFPSIVRLSEDRFLIANYSSPLDDVNISWIEGQVAEEGTGIYLIELSFVN